MEGSCDLPSWVDLPDLVIELILEHLPLPDYIRFAAVCRKWESIQKDHRLRHSPHPPPMGAAPPGSSHAFSPSARDLTVSPLEKRTRRLRFPTTPTFAGSTICMASSHGWLLMLLYDNNPTPPFSRRPFLFNPLSGAVISLPMLLIVCGEEYFRALSSPPYDPDCTILLLSGGSVSLCRSNDAGDGWTMGEEIKGWIDSVVYCGGKFYCMSTKGVLYVIDGVRSTPMLMGLTMDVSALHIRDGK